MKKRSILHAGIVCLLAAALCACSASSAGEEIEQQQSTAKGTAQQQSTEEEAGDAADTSFPSREIIATATDEEAIKLLTDKTEQEIHEHWGEPDGSFWGMYGDYYTHNDKTIAVYYDFDSKKVNDIKIGAKSEGMLQLDYAKNFAVELMADGSRWITVRTANDNVVNYLVVPEGMDVPEETAKNAEAVLQKPLDRLYMASSGMTSLIDAIGALDHVSLVATDVDGWYLPDVKTAMEQGDIRFGGKYDEPDYELMADAGIRLHIANTMTDNHPEVLSKFAELGIPSLIETSGKENHPLARVEWVKLFGVLFGMEAEAEAYFEEQKKLVEEAAGASTGKTVAMGYLSSDGNKYYVRNGGDYYAQMIGIAGGDYVCGDISPEEGGTSTVTAEEWYDLLRDADVLFYNNFSARFTSVEEMLAFYPLFADFKAVQNGCVFVSSPDFTQSTAAIASIIADMHTILSAEDPAAVTTDHLIRIE